MMDDLFRDYQTIDRAIAIRRDEINHPWRELDSNIGGGRSSRIAKPQEDMIVKYDEDIRLQYLYQLDRDCKRAINRFDEEQLEIYQLRYCADNYYDWDTIGDIMSDRHKDKAYPHTTIYRKRYLLLKILAEERGIVSKSGTGYGSNTNCQPL